jgi:hypothetical protein
MTDTFTAKGPPQVDHLTTIYRVGNSRLDGPSPILGNQSMHAIRTTTCENGTDM